MVVSTCIVGERQQIRDGICAEACLLDGFFGKEIDFIIDASGRFELAELAVALEFVTEGLALRAVRNKVMEVFNLFVERLPSDIIDAILKRGADIILRRPIGIAVVVKA